DLTAGAFGAVSAGSVGEAGGGRGSPQGSAGGPLREPLFWLGRGGKPSPPAGPSAFGRKGGRGPFRAWGGLWETPRGEAGGGEGEGQMAGGSEWGVQHSCERGS